MPQVHLNGMRVETHHQIEPLGLDKMRLFECKTNKTIAVATRDSSTSPWTASAPNTDANPHTVQDRNSAIESMISLALEVLPESGYSTTVPHVQVGEEFVSLRLIP